MKRHPSFVCNSWVLMGVLAVWMGGSRHAIAQDAPPPAPDAGFEITKSSVTIQAPPGLVGQRFVDTSVRVGKLPENLGTRTRHVQTVGSFVAKCPTASGLVEGTFVYELSFDQVIEENGENGQRKTLHVAHKISAALRGQTGDDALLENVEIDALLTLERWGTDQEELIQRKQIRASFLPDRNKGGLPTRISVGSASPWDVPDDSVASGEQGGTLFVAAMLFSGQTYFAAETGWRTPNTCVQLKFTPPSMSKALVPGSSTSVQAEVRTLDGDAAVAARFVLEELPRSGNGDVTPRQTSSTAGSPAQVTYRAPNTSVGGSGFRATVKSRAGNADASWLLADAFTLEFENRFWDDKISGTARVGYALFEGAVRFTVTLEPWAGRFRGEANTHRKLTVSHVTPQCKGSGAQDEEWIVLGDYDADRKILRLKVDSFPENQHASWTCPRMGTTELDLLAKVAAEIRELEVSAAVGSTQRVIKEVWPGRHEELKVTVTASPAK